MTADQLGQLVKALASAIVDELVARGVFVPTDETRDATTRIASTASQAKVGELIMGYTAAADYLDEPLEALRSAVRRGKLPFRRIAGKVAFRIEDLDERKLAQALMAESARPISADSGRFRPIPKSTNCDHSSNE